MAPSVFFIGLGNMGYVSTPYASLKMSIPSDAPH